MRLTSHSPCATEHSELRYGGLFSRYLQLAVPPQAQKPFSLVPRGIGKTAG